jgi:hypothetical protein
MVTMGACMIKDYGIAKHALFSYTHQLITASTASAVVRYCVPVPGILIERIGRVLKMQ